MVRIRELSTVPLEILGLELKFRRVLQQGHEPGMGHDDVAASLLTLGEDARLAFGLDCCLQVVHPSDGAELVAARGQAHGSEVLVLVVEWHVHDLAFVIIVLG